MNALKKIVQKILIKFGYKIVRNHNQDIVQPHYVLHEYKKPDGSFDYARYQSVQIAGNKEKIKQVWALEENIRFLSEYIAKTLTNPQFGLCHGTRQGKEQEWFKKHLECRVLGTEISETAEEYPNTIQWDFHDVKPEWLNSVDFIYSNALDHSYDPERCLAAWMSCLKSGGVCILEHTSGHEARAANELDPFGASLELMPYLIACWGKDKFYLLEMLPAPIKRNGVTFCNYLILLNRK
jgi:hypothetical protein